MEEYKPNSYKSKEESNDIPKKREKIVSSEVKTRKESLIGGFADLFVDTTKDIVIPAARNAAFEVIRSVASDILLGKDSRATKTTPGSYVSYQSYYGKDSGQRNSSGYSRDSYNYDEIILASKGEADAVLNEMDDIIRRYGFVKVGDLYDLVGINATYTDYNYGWTDLRTAYVTRVRDGYLLKLPKPMPID